jgi:hypothetical protein
MAGQPLALDWAVGRGFSQGGGGKEAGKAAPPLWLRGEFWEPPACGTCILACMDVKHGNLVPRAQGPTKVPGGLVALLAPSPQAGACALTPAGSMSPPDLQLKNQPQGLSEMTLHMPSPPWLGLCDTIYLFFLAPVPEMRLQTSELPVTVWHLPICFVTDVLCHTNVFGWLFAQNWLLLALCKRNLSCPSWNQNQGRETECERVLLRWRNSTIVPGYQAKQTSREITRVLSHPVTHENCSVFSSKCLTLDFYTSVG